MNRNLNRRIHPIAEADGLSPKKPRKWHFSVEQGCGFQILHYRGTNEIRDGGKIRYRQYADSGTTLIAAANLNRKAYGFEIKKDFYKKANELIKTQIQLQLF